VFVRTTHGFTRFSITIRSLGKLKNFNHTHVTDFSPPHPLRSYMSQFTASTSSQQAEKDIEVVDPPADSISCLSFSPVADYLAVGSWDNKVSLCSQISLSTVVLSRVSLLSDVNVE
jgi:WD40 repeat protein